MSLGTESHRRAGFSRADDGVRTRDPQLGKLMLYQLSYVREGANHTVPAARLLFRERQLFRHHPNL
jgi:hypothetical protein